MVSKSIGKPAIKCPKGFDITLTEIFEQYELSEHDMSVFRDAHKKGSKLAWATIDKCSFYRKHQIDAMFKHKEEATKLVEPKEAISRILTQK